MEIAGIREIKADTLIKKELIEPNSRISNASTNEKV